ncbi:MAG TPA: VWA domain-containing protein [Candidatus Microsaccharimonas sp.]|jgi:hypothetical protein
MAVSLTKVRDEAPHLVSLVKETNRIVTGLGVDLSVDKAAVIAVIDDSGSAQPLFKSGEIQRVADLSFAAGLAFDDDGSMPVSFFNNYVQDLGEITLSNCSGFIAKQKPQWGGTSYVSALKWIIGQAGYSNVDLGKSGGGLFGGKLSAKAHAEYPTFAIFITDGEPGDGPAASELLKLMSQLPIFVQFIGVGPARFPYLEKLDDLKGRFIDNAGFFDAKKAKGDQTAMLQGLLNEFPDYLKKAKSAGLIG